MRCQFEVVKMSLYLNSMTVYIIMFIQSLMSFLMIDDNLKCTHCTTFQRLVKDIISVQLPDDALMSEDITDNSSSDFSLNLSCLPRCSTLDLMAETISQLNCAFGLGITRISGIDSWSYKEKPPLSEKESFSVLLVDFKKKHGSNQDQTLDFHITWGNPATGHLILTCRIFWEGLAGDGSRWLLEGVGGGGGGCAGAGVVTCHVGWSIGWAVVILSILALSKGWITGVLLRTEREVVKR